MKTFVPLFRTCLLASVALSAALSAKAVTFTVDPSATWSGYMNVFELPSNGGGYVFGSGWGTADLSANFSGPVLTLSPNTIGDTSPFWYIGGGGPGAAGNKIMDANFYQEFNGSLAGQTVNFTGNVLANSLTSAHNAYVFIKDFAPDYSSSVTVTAPLSAGLFDLSLLTINDPARHVQFGFTVNGVNVWITDVAPFGSVQITAVPEPATGAFLIGGIACLIACRRNKTDSQI